MPNPNRTAGALRQPIAGLERRNESPDRNTNDTDGTPGRKNTNKTHSSGQKHFRKLPWNERLPILGQRDRRSTFADSTSLHYGALAHLNREPVRSPTIKDNDTRVKRLTPGSRPRLNISTERGRERGATIAVPMWPPDPDGIFSDSSASPKSASHGIWDAPNGTEGRGWAYRSPSTSPDLPYRNHENDQERNSNSDTSSSELSLSDLNLHPDPKEEASPGRAIAITEEKVQYPYHGYFAPESPEEEVTEHLDNIAREQLTPQDQEVFSTVEEQDLSRQHNTLKPDSGTPRNVESVQAGSGAAGNTSIDGLAEENVSPSKSSEPRFSGSSHNPSSSPKPSWDAFLRNGNTVVGDDFTGSFASPTWNRLSTFEKTTQSGVQAMNSVPVSPSSRSSPGSYINGNNRGNFLGTVVDVHEEREASSGLRQSSEPFPKPRYSGSDMGTAIRDDLSDQEEQEPSHDKTVTALSKVYQMKAKVERHLERTEIEHRRMIEDHAAEQEKLRQKIQDLHAESEEQEAKHNDTRIAMIKVFKEKNEAQQNLGHAVAEYRQKLQAVGIITDENAQPVWEIDSEGRQTRPLYKDVPNMRREAHVNLLIVRANCKFMLADYDEMAKLAFEALEVAEKLLFRPLLARCNFIIGIAFYHSHRFGEAHSRFWQAQGCQNKYGISPECIKRWLEKCNDGIAGDASATDFSSTLTNHTQNTSHNADNRFRADTFFERATNIPGSGEWSSDNENEGVEGHKAFTSQISDDDDDDETQTIQTSGADSRRQLSLEEELSFSDMDDDSESE